MGSAETQRQAAAHLNMAVPSPDTLGMNLHTKTFECGPSTIAGCIGHQATKRWAICCHGYSYRDPEVPLLTVDHICLPMEPYTTLRTTFALSRGGWPTLCSRQTSGESVLTLKGRWTTILLSPRTGKLSHISRRGPTKPWEIRFISVTEQRWTPHGLGAMSVQGMAIGRWTFELGLKTSTLRR